MKRSGLFTLLLMSWLVAAADEKIALVNPAELASDAVNAPRAWLGLRVAKPDLTLTAQVPGLPQGIGFVVTSIDDGGPAMHAGFREFDLVWKLGDQLLVNEAQLATLLRLHHPGDEITLLAFRGGKSVEMKLKLGETPISEQPFPPELMDSMLLQGDAKLPMRVVNVAEKSASYSADDGRAIVQRDGEFYQVQIHDSAEKLLFEGRFSEGQAFERVPEPWQRRILALRRSLDQTLSGAMLLTRQPRPRVVPPPPVKP